MCFTSQYFTVMMVFRRGSSSQSAGCVLGCYLSPAEEPLIVGPKNGNVSVWWAVIFGVNFTGPYILHVNQTYVID
jgi:hypothetical protein